MPLPSDPKHLQAAGSRVRVRPALAAGLAFLDVEQPFGAGELVVWLEDFLAKPGLMPMPTTVYEHGAGGVPIRERPASSWSQAFEVQLAGIVAAARMRVSRSLGGLIAIPADDRFLAAAIYAHRVERRAGGWAVSLKGTERLSDMVLSLLAADILAHREEYDAKLGVCAMCGRFWLAQTASTRTRCPKHAPSLPGQRAG
jgi:hypothetical protein